MNNLIKILGVLGLSLGLLGCAAPIATNPTTNSDNPVVSEKQQTAQSPAFDCSIVPTGKSNIAQYREQCL